MIIKILLSILAILSGPATIIITLPFYNWSAVGGIMTALIISFGATASIWQKSKSEGV